MREFTITEARRLIDKMRIRYGKKFTDFWAAVDEADLEQAMIEDFSGLTVQQLENGYNRMLHEPWPPCIQDFKIWCLQGSHWLTENEAWQQALAYEKSNQTISISVHVLKTLKEFKKGFDELNPRAESQSKAFKDMYVRIVSNAKLMGDVQAFTDPVGALKAPKEDERRITTCPPELMAQLKGVNKNSNAGRA
ncbi:MULTISPECIES: hypothetical protein [Acinetobacter]|uniref:hypothetical protein n=1 Tax=Acinetobacter TaxID=469 RepID=UPI000EA31543|nr:MULTISPECIES: hypothetical protein [Acinetobacter]RKG43809.1 hypothetical protein D7V51_09085 [Acinetobacter cumulans]RZG59524.1 hypothetical protein EXE29_07905 [Acinetobacter sp. WCHAc060006]